ncbi:MAG: hypothetical protein Q9226_002125 [Calogaya cf. arnoldii]
MAPTRPFPPFQLSLFESRLREYNVDAGDDIYKFYERMHSDAQNLSRSSTDSIQAVLATEADNEETDSLAVHPWRRRKNPIESTTQSTVWLWEKEGTSDNNDRILQLVVKDAKLHEFWRDQPSEGILLRKLYDVGCKTVIKVHDWIYRERSPHNEEGIIRIVEEYAEHGDLESVLDFYIEHKLILPEAFLWHIFWSAANTLCYCRHGTTDSPETIDGWDPMFHMDVKPGNLLMAGPDGSVNQFYPSIKMCDFGGAYTLPETGYDQFRRWKSTWTFGTEYFRAPEVRILNHSEQGKFSRTSGDYGLHGSHTDIFCLGKTINYLVGRNLLVWADEPEDFSEHVERYYSTDLRLLIHSCTKQAISKRPSAYELLERTLEGTRKYQRIARKEQADAEDGWPFHSELLYSTESQEKFGNDPEFRMRYEQVNRAPLETGVKTVDPGEDDTPSPTSTLSIINDDELAALEASVNAQNEPRRPAAKPNVKAKPKTARKPRAQAKPAPKAKPASKAPGRPARVLKQSSAPDPNGGPASRTRSRVPNAQDPTGQAPAAGKAGTKRKSDNGPAGGNKRVRFSDEDDDEDEDEPVAGPSKSAGKGSAKGKGKAKTSAKASSKKSTKTPAKKSTKTAAKSSTKKPTKTTTKTATKTSAKTAKGTTGIWKCRLRGG